MESNKAVDKLTTMICVEDANKSVRFYVDAFGFQAQEIMNDKQGEVLFARLKYRNDHFIILPTQTLVGEDYMLPPILSKSPSPVSFYLYCEDFNSKYKELKKYEIDHKVKFLQRREIKFWGDKVFSVMDFNGYIWNFAVEAKVESDATKLFTEVI